MYSCICVIHTKNSRFRPLNLTDPLISDPLPKTDAPACLYFSRSFPLFSGSSLARESSHWGQLAEALQSTFTQGLMGSLSIKNSWHLTPQHGGQIAWRALIGWTSLLFPQQSTKIDLSLSFESSGVNRGVQIILTCVNNVCVWGRDLYGTPVCNSVLMKINNLWKQIRLHIHEQLT